MSAHLIVGGPRTGAAVLEREALAELALDLSAFAKVLAERAPRASAAALDQCIGRMRDVVASMKDTLAGVGVAEGKQ